MASELVVSLPSSSGVVAYPPGASFGPRLMHEWEFVWLIEGDAEYRWGDSAVAAPEGSIVLCRPGATDFFQWDQDRRTLHGYFHFQVHEAPAEWPPTDQWSLVRMPAAEDILIPLFRHLLGGQGQWDELQGRLTVAHLLASFVRGDAAARDAPRTLWPDAVARAWKFLQEHLETHPAAPVCLGDLAAAACVAPEHLCRLFQSATGRSPMETVRLARLDRAASLLARSNYSASEIADFCGFANPFHFSRRFKEAFGQSPTAMRRAIRSGATPPLPRLLELHRVG